MEKRLEREGKGGRGGKEGGSEGGRDGEWERREGRREGRWEGGNMGELVREEHVYING